jgi:hypothetical protein
VDRLHCLFLGRSLWHVDFFDDGLFFFEAGVFFCDLQGSERERRERKTWVDFLERRVFNYLPIDVVGDLEKGRIEKEEREGYILVACLWGTCRCLGSSHAIISLYFHLHLTSLLI